jgi:hypothetical protein
MQSESDGYIDARTILQSFVGPWYESLKNPAKAQQNTLRNLLEGYGATEYGEIHSAKEIENINDYQARFPIANYHNLQPYIKRVQEGNYRALLSEPPECWVMTRGSTGKQSKVIPATPTHLRQIFLCGARAIIHFATRTEDYEALTGNILNLNFPSSVHTMIQNGSKMTYGYRKTLTRWARASEEQIGKGGLILSTNRRLTKMSLQPWV